VWLVEPWQPTCPVGDPRSDIASSFPLTTGTSANLTFSGDATLTDFGLQLDGAGDNAKIPNFDYASDSSFTISLWFSKQQCHTFYWEYLYSHAENATLDLLDGLNDNVNIYMGCEASWGASTAGVHTNGKDASAGSFLRTIMVDEAGTVGVIDLDLHEDGAFTDVLTKWTQISLRVTPTGIAYSLNGVHQPDSSFAVYSHMSSFANPVLSTFWPSPSSLNRPFTSFLLASDIFLGGRADGDVDRHFHGSIFGLTVYASSVDSMAAFCGFTYEMATAPTAPLPPTCNVVAGAPDTEAVGTACVAVTDEASCPATLDDGTAACEWASLSSDPDTHCYKKVLFACFF
jgi:hypothetical protein